MIPGTYSLTLTASGKVMGTKELKFDLTVTKPPSCTGNLIGRYNNCLSYCKDQPYSDSVYEDPIIGNRVWFSNFIGSGKQVYGIMNCDTRYLTIPPQLINGVSYEGIAYCPYMMEISLHLHYKTTECTVTMH